MESMPIGKKKIKPLSYLQEPHNWQEAALMLPQDAKLSGGLYPPCPKFLEDDKGDSSKDAFTALHLSCHAGDMEAVKLLLRNNDLENFLNKEICSFHGDNSVTPLCCAVFAGFGEVVQLLLDNGADVNVCCGDPLKSTPLHMAAGDVNNDGACLQVLLKAGASHAVTNAKGETPLHIAAATNNLDSLKLLLSAGADPNARDMNGRTPLHFLVLNGQKSVEEFVQLYLRDKRVDANAQDMEGYTALHLSAMNERSTVSMLLVKNGADVTLKTTGGVTALSMLARKLPHVINILIERLDSGVSVFDHDLTDINCELKMDFGVLIPPKRQSIRKTVSSKKKDAEITEDNTLLSLERRKETELLTCLVSTGNKKILAHPLVEAFLLVKWRRVRKFFLASLLFQMALVALFTVFVVEVYLIRCPYRRNRDDASISVSMQQSTTVFPPHQLSKRHAHPASKDEGGFHWFQVTPSKHKKHPKPPTTLEEPPTFHPPPPPRHSSFHPGPVPAGAPARKQGANTFTNVGQPLTTPFSVDRTTDNEELFLQAEVQTPQNDSRSSSSADKANRKGVPEAEKDNDDDLSHECSLSTALQIIWFLLILSISIMSLQEVFQMVHSPSRYVTSSENLAQWLLIASVFITAWQGSTDGESGTFHLDYWQYPAAACGILIAWGLILFQVGRFPSLGLYVEMLGKVATNFGLFILAYACLLIAFALSFCVLFPEHPPFSSVPMSILKVFTMMVGEVDYEDLFYSEERLNDPIIFPLTAHLLFGAFVLIMTIVLMNLLVGLAVSDIQGLQKGAKLDRLSRQTALIARFESFIFSKKLQVVLPSALILLVQNNALLTSSVSTQDQLTFHFHPNDQRDRSVPKDIKQAALRLVASNGFSKHSHRSILFEDKLTEKPRNRVVSAMQVKRSFSSVSHHNQRTTRNCLENRSASNQSSESYTMTEPSNVNDITGYVLDRLVILESKLENAEKGIEKILQFLLENKTRLDTCNNDNNAKSSL